MMWRDIDQDYLLGWAAVHGVNPYLRIPKLAEEAGFQFSVYLLPHPSPHPPTVILWMIPLTFVDRISAAYVWFGLSVSCLLASAVILVKSFKVGTQWLPNAAILSAVLVLIAPTKEDLFFGQYGFFQLVLLLFAWLKLREDKGILSGMYLGIAITLKTNLWPILVYFVLAKHRRVLTGVAVTYLPVLGTVLGLFGLGIFTVYGAAVKETVNYWQYFPMNMSICNALSSLAFGRTVSLHGLFHVPSVDPVSPGILGTLFSVMDMLLWAAFFIAVMYKALRKDKQVGVAFWRVAGACTILSPIGWLHYTVLLIPFWVSMALEWSKDRTSRLKLQHGASLVLLWPMTHPMFGSLLSVTAEMGWVNWLPSGAFRVPMILPLLMKVPVFAVAWIVLRYEPSALAELGEKKSASQEKGGILHAA